MLCPAARIEPLAFGNVTWRGNRLAKWIGSLVTWTVPVMWMGALLLIIAFMRWPEWRYSSAGTDRQWMAAALLLAAWTIHVGVAFHVAVSFRFMRDDRRTVWRQLWRRSYSHYRRVLGRFPSGEQ